MAHSNALLHFVEHLDVLQAEALVALAENGNAMFAGPQTKPSLEIRDPR